MNLDNLHPVAVAHAVQEVHFAVEWGEALAGDAVLGLGKLQSKFKKIGYGHMLPQMRLSVKIDGGAAGPSFGGATNQALGGYLFMQRDQSEVGRRVAITAEGCTVSVPDYTRWDSAFTSVQEILKVVLEEVAPIRPIRSIGLQYTDAFVWNDDPEELDLREVFKADFVIPENVFKQKGLWHLHHGYFESFSDAQPYSVLQNLNVDMLDAGSGRRLQIVTSHKASLNSLLWQSHKKNREAFLAVFSHLHIINKEMLKSLLTSNVCRRIKLETGE